MPLVRAPAMNSTGAMRFYAAGSGLSRSDIEKRIIDILKVFDKVQNPEKISASSSFSKDLGLDSLDTVEVVMAIEEEFSLEIPDSDADAIQSVADAIKYVESHAEAL